MQHADRMTPIELRASAGLAGIFGLRMLGMFLILPVFAIYATGIPGGENHALIGLALGAYGLTQALLQLPFGMASDRFGRKRVIYFGLILFVLGSFIAASAHDIYWVIIGRSIQGAGAISAAVTALLADLTREEHRTKAMAMIGSTIGLMFALSMVLGPALYQFIGVPGMFALTGVLALLAMVVVAVVIPDPPASHFHSDAEVAPARLKDVLQDKQLLRLNFGIFSLHAAQMAMFTVIPLALIESGNLAQNQHWKIYLPVMLLAFAFMVPAIIVAEKKAKLKQVFVMAVALLLLTQISLTVLVGHFWGIVAALMTFFIAFNILEATLPSLISKLAPAQAKGTAMGVYNTSQSLGLFVGGVSGGLLAHQFGHFAVFVFGATLSAVWLWLALSMRTPPAVKTRMYHLEVMDASQARVLAQRLATVPGVAEADVSAEERVAYLKVNMAGWDEEQVLKLIDGGV
ncbi:MAG: MFS transporter [Sulfurimicrobium sp.]|nr:MFS transporter [Sulfurimicrobium sp.]MDP3687054.1 MFS transporter [Sulfurimicrobium sp.]